MRRMLALLLPLAAAAETAMPARVAVTPLPARSGDGWYVLPDLHANHTPPDVLTQARPATWAEAALVLLRGVADGSVPVAKAADGTRWLRLDGIDLCAVAECDECRPEPPDQHEVLNLDDIERTTADGLDFLRAVREAAEPIADLRLYSASVLTRPRSRPARPTGSAGIGPGPPMAPRAAGPMAPHADAGRPEWVFLAGPEIHVPEQDRRIASSHFDLHRDDTELLGLPLSAPAEAAVLAESTGVGICYRPQALGRRDPEWLAARRRAVEGGATSPLGDPYRATMPELARALDIFAPLREHLAAPPFELAAALVDSVVALDGWFAGTVEAADADAARRDRSLDLAQHPVLLAQFEALRRLPLERVTVDLPAAPAATLDGMLVPGEWQGARRLDLPVHDDGSPTPRPAVAWLGLAEGELRLAISATEPDPADASMGDRVLLWFAREGADEVHRVSLTVGGERTGLRIARLGSAPESYEPEGVRSAALFDGPGFTLEAALPLPGPGPWRVNIGTEHRSRYDRGHAMCRPTAGAPWDSRRYLRLASGQH